MFDKLRIHVLELPKLEKNDYPETELLKWARLFNATNKEELEMAAEGNEYTKGDDRNAAGVWNVSGRNTDKSSRKVFSI